MKIPAMIVIFIRMPSRTVPANISKVCIRNTGILLKQRKGHTLAIPHAVAKSGDSNWHSWSKNLLLKILNIKRVLINFVISIEERYVMFR